MDKTEGALHYSLQEIADYLEGELIVKTEAEKTAVIIGLASLRQAKVNQLTFLSRADYAKYLPECGAAAVIVGNKIEIDADVPLIKVSNAYLAYAKVSTLFDRRPKHPVGIHPTAYIDATANIAITATIGAHTVIEAGVKIGEGTIIGAGCIIGAGSVVGKNCLVHANVTLYHEVDLGDEVLLHSGVVIGSDGFGFAPKAEGGWQKIHQLGCVLIGNRVEVGANSTIDRGAIEDTVIEDGVIIDNQVQIAHNVRIGKNTAIAACTGIAGSTSIGANCTIAGAVGIVGHLTIVDNVHITAMTLVTGSINKAGSYSSGTNLLPTKDWRRQAVRFGQLDSMAKRLKSLERE